MNSDLVGIGEAAELLGLSRTSLQKLVDGGHLKAIKTTGGHRRISRQSLHALSDKMGIGSVSENSSKPGKFTRTTGTTRTKAGKLSILLTEDDEVVITQITSLLAKNFPDVECAVARDGLDAVLQLERIRPSVLITDLNMMPFDGFTLISLVKSKPEYSDISIVVITSMTDAQISRKGGLPPGVVLYRKPLSGDRLMGFIDAYSSWSV